MVEHLQWLSLAGCLCQSMLGQRLTGLWELMMMLPMKQQTLK
jgi:hypothetical protein